MSNDTIPVGQDLKLAREALSLSISDVIAILKIKQQVIEIIESDQYPEQTLDIFIKGHIVTYSKLLKVNPQTIINKLEAKGYDFPIKQNNENNTIQKTTSTRKIQALLLIVLGYIIIQSIHITPQTNTRKITPPMLQEKYYEQ